jgi:hypothetical protein
MRAHVPGILLLVYCLVPLPINVPNASDEPENSPSDRGALSPNADELVELASLAAVALPAKSAGQRLILPIVVPFERAPSPFIVIRVPFASGPCEAMLFDTGTNTTLLASAQAARVGLSVGGETVVESLNGSKAVITGEVPGIGFDGIPVHEPRVASATDLPSLPGFGRAIAGVYGHNWLTGIDYLIDYDARWIVMGAPGTLPASHGGHRTALSWTEGLPAVTGEIRGQSIEPFPARFVLDSGTDHVTLFGRAAERMQANDRSPNVLVNSGFGTRALPTARS